MWVFFAAFLVFYVWIVRTGVPFTSNHAYSGPYGGLADAFAHGQLSLRDPPPPGLLDLVNPYDPIANNAFRHNGLHDLTLWHGKLYVYWGPVPALLLVPLQLVGVWVPQNLVTVGLGFGALVFSVLTLRFLVARFLPATPAWAVWAGMLSLALCNVVPFTLRRPAQYEIAIDGALCFGFLALWLLSTGWFGPRPSVHRLAGASLAIGLAVGCRPTAGLYALVPLTLVVGAWRSGRWPVAGAGRRRATMTALAAPLGVCVALLLAYNAARFGTPLEFGQKYQLSGFDQTHRALGHLSYLAPGLFYYVLLPPRLLATFPFLGLGPPPKYPWGLPADYTGVEMTAGVLPTIPLLAGLVLLPWVARRWDPGLRAIAGAMVATAALTTVLLAFMVWGTTQRYEVDFVSLLLIPALLVWYTALVWAPRRRWPRRLVAVAGTAALIWGAAAGLAESFRGYTDGLAAYHPQLYRAFVDAFSPLSRVLASAKGGPVITRIDSTANVDADTTANADKNWSSLGLGNFAFDLTTDRVTLTIASPGHRDALLRLAASTRRASLSSVRSSLFVGLDGAAPLARILRPSGIYDFGVELAPGVNRVVVSSDAGTLVRVTAVGLVAPGTPAAAPQAPAKRTTP
ncbi:MAG: hypothetical protein QOH30_2355 [Baekduia sp.]|nr:hypothetical protein [Baekduia sp.]